MGAAALRAVAVASIGGAAARERFVLDVSVDGQARPLPFLRGDDVDAVAARWVDANPSVVAGAFASRAGRRLSMLRPSRRRREQCRRRKRHLE